MRSIREVISPRGSSPNFLALSFALRFEYCGNHDPHASSMLSPAFEGTKHDKALFGECSVHGEEFEEIRRDRGLEICRFYELPGNEALHKPRFGCHEPAKDHDYIFTRYAPTP